MDTVTLGMFIISKLHNKPEMTKIPRRVTIENGDEGTRTCETDVDCKLLAARFINNNLTPRSH